MTLEGNPGNCSIQHLCCMTWKEKGDEGMNLNELLSFVVQERMGYFYRNKKKEQKEEYKEKCEKWEQIVREKCPELAEVNQDYINWFMLCQGEELEEGYLFGVQDGIRLMMKIMEASERENEDNMKKEKEKGKGNGYDFR